MIVLLDNYDSFTYNLYQILAQYEEVKIFRNDKITLKEIEKINPKGIIISPGPGRPENAGILIDMVKRFKGIYPMLGVCLGHQGIAASFGGNVIRAKEIVHGKRSLVTLKKSKLFKGINEKEEVMRYHSLIVERESLPKELEIIAETDDKEIISKFIEKIKNREESENIMMNAARIINKEIRKQRREGREEGMIFVAKKLKGKMHIKDISQITGLSEKEIEKL